MRTDRRTHSESRVVPCGQTDGHTVRAELFRADRQTDGYNDMTKLTVAFCNFADGPKKRRDNIKMYRVINNSQNKLNKIP